MPISKTLCYSILLILTTSCSKNDTTTTTTSSTTTVTTNNTVPVVYNKIYGATSITNDGTYITLKTKDDEFMPWVATQCDILAEDWEILE